MIDFPVEFKGREKDAIDLQGLIEFLSALGGNRKNLVCLSQMANMKDQHNQDVPLNGLDCVVEVIHSKEDLNSIGVRGTKNLPVSYAPKLRKFILGVPVDSNGKSYRLFCNRIGTYQEIYDTISQISGMQKDIAYLSPSREMI